MGAAAGIEALPLAHKANAAAAAAHAASFALPSPSLLPFQRLPGSPSLGLPT